jgi:hypothetical protein
MEDGDSIDAILCREFLSFPSREHADLGQNVAVDWEIRFQVLLRLQLPTTTNLIKLGPLQVNVNLPIRTRSPARPDYR